MRFDVRIETVLSESLKLNATWLLVFSAELKYRYGFEI